MKPLQIVLLMVAGAVGGAVVMRVWQRVQPAAREAVVARDTASAPVGKPASVPPPAAEPSVAVKPVPAPAPVTSAEPPAHPSRFSARREATRPRPVHRIQPASKPKPALVAKVEPAPVSSLPVAVPAAEAPQPPALLPSSRAHTEPENATPSYPQSAPPPPEPPHMVTLNTGMLIPVCLVDGLSSERNRPGDTFIATLDRELVVDGFVIAERGSLVEGRVVAVDRGGNVRGMAALAVELTRLYTSDRQRVAIQTDSFERRSEPPQREDAEKVGAGDVLPTRGKPATLPSEIRLNFRLRAAVTLTEKRG